MEDMDENYNLSPAVVQQRSAGVKHSLDQAAALKKARKVPTMNEDLSPIADTITLVANGQAGEATPIVHDLLGARVLDALQGHKQEIAQTLFAPSADSLTEETEQLDEGFITAADRAKVKAHIQKHAPEHKIIGIGKDYITHELKYEIEHKKTGSRETGTLEESEQLDELSTKTLLNYSKKAKIDSHREAIKGDKAKDSDVAYGHLRRGQRRYSGLSAAAEKLRSRGHRTARYKPFDDAGNARSGLDE